MKFIDKLTHQEHANTLVNSFLDSGWSESESSYLGISYSNLLPEIKDFIKKSQDWKCAYCMQNVEGRKSSFEHLIPDNIPFSDEKEFQRYFELATPLQNNIIHKDIFRNTKSKLLTPPFPHDIAWYNLVLTCKDPGHCNASRGNQFIRPFILNKQEIEKVCYDIQGLCFSIDHVLMDEIQILKLNQRFLRQIREVCFGLKGKFRDLEDLKQKKDLALAYIEKIDANHYGYKGVFQGNENWDVLLSYTYFLFELNFL